MNEPTKNRTKTAGYSHVKADARKDKRRREAESRHAIYNALPAEVKLTFLDTRNYEARRERARLYPALHGVVIVPNRKAAQ